MAAITLTATGSNTQTTTTGIAAAGHRDYHIYNPSEHTIIVNILGSVTAGTFNVEWRNIDTALSELPGTRNNARGLIVGPGEFRNVAVLNNHTALQQISFTAESAHNAGSYVGDVVYIGTLNTVQAAAVN